MTGAKPGSFNDRIDLKSISPFELFSKALAASPFSMKALIQFIRESITVNFVGFRSKSFGKCRQLSLAACIRKLIVYPKCSFDLGNQQP